MMHFFKNLNASRQLLFCLTSAITLTLLSSTAGAWQAKPSDKAAAQVNPKTEQVNKKDVKAAPKKLTDSRIAELRAFAKQHHKEIMPLLNFLEKKQPKRFNKVMTGLDRSVSNLEKAKLKSPAAYQIGLAAWVNQSRIELYAAQFKVADDEETAAKLREKIQELVAEKIDARIEYLEQELAAMQPRMNRLEKAIENQKATREATIQKRINLVTKQAPNMGKSNKGAPGKEKPAKKDKTEQPAPVKPPQKTGR